MTKKNLLTIFLFAKYNASSDKWTKFDLLADFWVMKKPQIGYLKDFRKNANLISQLGKNIKIFHIPDLLTFTRFVDEFRGQGKFTNRRMHCILKRLINFIKDWFKLFLGLLTLFLGQILARYSY